jgi:hypothetical protein
MQNRLLRIESGRCLLNLQIYERSELGALLFVIASPIREEFSCLTKEESKPKLLRFLPLVKMTI